MEKAVLERDAKVTQNKLNEAQLRLDEADRNLSDLETLRNKLIGENVDLERKLDESTLQVSQLNKIKANTYKFHFLLLSSLYIVQENLAIRSYHNSSIR